MKRGFDYLREELQNLNGRLCAIDIARFPTLLPVISDLVAGRDVPDARLSALRPRSIAFAPSMAAVSRVPAGGGPGRGVAIVRARGVATYDLEFQPYCFSTRRLAEAVSELADDKTIGRIVVQFDTPGGAVTGTPEAGDAIYAARGKKPVFAVVDPLSASAGYWLASQCSRIVAIPSGDVGSVGVFMLHVELSKMLESAGVKPTLIFAGENKTEGNSYEPLTDRAKSFFQTEIDKTYEEFVAMVARGRRVSTATVRSQYGAGRCFSAKDALRIGMIDGIEEPTRVFTSISLGRFSSVIAEPTQSQITAASRRRRLSILEQG